MKFKEMSLEELKKDFEKLLNSFTTSELVDSLEEYAINENDFQYALSKKNNLFEDYGLNEMNIENNLKEEEYIKNNTLEIENNEYIGMEDAA